MTKRGAFRDSSAGARSAHLEPEAREPLAPSVALPWIIQLRFLLAAGEVALVLLSAETDAAVTKWAWCGLAVGLQIAANLWLAHIAPRPEEGFEHPLGVVFALDALALTVVFAFTGGPTNPFTLLYLVQITLSAIILHKAWTWALGLLSTLCYGSLFLFSAMVSAHSHELSETMIRHVVGMWIAFGLAAGVLTFFIGQVSETLQRRQREVLELQRQVARQERLGSLVTLAAGAAHELSTPLGTIAIASREIERAAERRGGDAAMVEDARLIRSQVERCRGILADMSAKGAEPFGEAPSAIEIGEVFRRVIEGLPEVERSRLDVDQTNCHIRLETFPASVAQSALALVRNSLDASPDGQPVFLGAEADADSVTFIVRDEGEGMNDETLARVAEPFFTRKPPGEGMGLGAFLAHLFASRMGGELRYESTLGQGATAYLMLPRNRS